MNTQTLASIVAATLGGSFAWALTNEANELASAGYVEVNAAVPGGPEGHVAARATDAGIAFHNSQTAQQNQGGADAFAGFGGNVVSGDAGAPAQSHAVNPAGGVPQSQGTANAGAGATDPNAKPVFIPATGFTPAPKAARAEGARREQPEKYPFGELKAPTQTGVDAQGQPTYSYEGAAIFVPSTFDKKQNRVRTAKEMAFSLQSACSAANRRYATVKGEKTGADGKKRKEYEYTRKFEVQEGTGPNGEAGAFIYRSK